MLKIDVEGAEHLELTSLETLHWLSQNVKVILIEWHSFGNEKVAVQAFRYLRSIGFRSFFTEFRFRVPTFLQVESLINCGLLQKLQQQNQ